MARGRKSLSGNLPPRSTKISPNVFRSRLARYLNIKPYTVGVNSRFIHHASGSAPSTADAVVGGPDG